MKKYFHVNSYLYLLVLISFFPLLSSAETVEGMPSQEINVTINPDYTATGSWRIPLRLPTGYNQIGLPEFKSYGNAYSTRYVLNGVTNGNKDKMNPERLGDEFFAVTPNKNDLKTTSLYANYTLYPSFTQPAAIYEFWIDDGPYRLSPTVNISFPKNWKVLTYWPNEAVVSGNKINLSYPIKYPDIKPVVVVFQTSSNGVVEKYGKYTVTGTSDQVKKIEGALSKLSFVDSLMTQTVGIKLPDNILIVVDDITKSGSLGYEIDALAARPSVVLFNSQLLNSKSTNEIAGIISHELLHVAMQQQSLFHGKEYSAPWVTEGIAVFFENQAHNKIFTDPTEKILNEELDRTNIVSPAEATSLYESNFDFNFDGSRYLGTVASYKHAGILFANLYNLKGVSGFNYLFKSLESYTLQMDGGIPTAQVKGLLKDITGLSENDLLYPGKDTKTVTQIISKIERPENDEDASSKIVTDYIKNGIKHYFSIPNASTSSVVTSSQPIKSATVTANTITQVPGCNAGYKYSSITGQVCPVQTTVTKNKSTKK